MRFTPCLSPAVLVSCLGLAVAATLGGCASLRVTRVQSAQAKPNNVWVFFTVEHKEEPVASLTANDFRVYEDDQLVSAFESKQVILNPEVAAVMYTMLLLDMSGSVTESGEADALVDAAKGFVNRVGAHQKVGVYAFDGAEKIHSVVPFTEAVGSVEGGLEGLRTYRAKDPSTNLHGAVVSGLSELEKALAKDERPLKFGTVVVFTDGTDRAARVTRDEMRKTLASEAYKDYEVYAIGVGAEITRDRLQEIGREGTEMASDPGAVNQAFDRVARRIEDHMKRFYLFSYCSPARKSDHRVRIEARSPKLERSGRLEWSFNADGFGPPPECDPNRKPTFKLDITKVGADDGSRDAGSQRSGEAATKVHAEGSVAGSRKR